jgi:hypothetical protein
MPTFKWDISETSGEANTTQDGSMVELSDLQPIKGAAWVIELPNKNLALVPVNGGVVEAKASGDEVKKASASGALGSLNTGRKFNETVILIVLIVLSAAFLAVVIQGVLYGTLDFQTFTNFVLALLAAFGFSAITKTIGKGNDSS